MTEREFCCIPKRTDGRVSTSLHFSARPVNVRSQFLGRVAEAIEGWLVRYSAMASELRDKAGKIPTS
jgi:hypothetical protein